jgi:hypothetical protein
VNDIYKINKIKEVKMVQAMEKIGISGMTAAILMILFGIAIIDRGSEADSLVSRRRYFIIRGIWELVPR